MRSLNATNMRSALVSPTNGGSSKWQAANLANHSLTITESNSFINKTIDNEANKAKLP